MKDDMRSLVKSMIVDLRGRIEREVPEVGEFPMVYSEFKNPDRGMCLTDVMLTCRAIPEQLPNHETDRWLELVGYKLPVPYKSTMIIFKGKKREILEYLDKAEAEDKILDVIPKLDFNLSDV